MRVVATTALLALVAACSTAAPAPQTASLPGEPWTLEAVTPDTSDGIRILVLRSEDPGVEVERRGLGSVDRIGVLVAEAGAQIAVGGDAHRREARGAADLARNGDVDGLARLVRARARESAPGERHEVRLEAADAPVRFWGDPALLRQALSNLVSNAEQAMRGGGRLTISARRTEDGVELAVADQGVGIPAELQARVFDLYFTTKPEGSGIGLAVVKQVAQLHGGRVALRSVPGEGTEITIHLPVRTHQLIGDRLDSTHGTEHVSNHQGFAHAPAWRLAAPALAAIVIAPATGA